MEKIEQIEKYISGCRDFAIKKQMSKYSIEKIAIKTGKEFYAIEENIYSEILEKIQQIKNS